MLTGRAGKSSALDCICAGCNCENADSDHTCNPCKICSIPGSWLSRTDSVWLVYCRTFAGLAEDPTFHFRQVLNPGDIEIVHNPTILHSRGNVDDGEVGPGPCLPSPRLHECSSTANHRALLSSPHEIMWLTWLNDAIHAELCKSLCR